MATNLVEIKINEKQMSDITGMLRNFPRGLPKVVSRAINKTATAAKTASARDIADKLQGKVGVIKAGILVIKATQARWAAMLRYGAKKSNVIEWGGKWIRSRKTNAGVRWRIGGKAQSNPHAFIQQMPATGYTGVFIRKGKARYPIKGVFAPSLSDVMRFDGEKILRDTQTAAAASLEKEISSQADLLLKGITR